MDHHTPIEESTKKKVYIITNHNSGDILEKELKKLEFISEIKKGSPNIINQMNESFLSLFDCFIYDLCDCGFKIDHEKQQEIEQYIKNDGGSFLVTHDHWDNVNKAPLNLIGLEYFQNFPYIRTNKARICLSHELFNSFNDLTNMGIMNIATTHQTNHKIIEKEDNKARAIIELEIDKPTNIRHDYLVVNEIGFGRIAYWAAGDSNTISEDEKKLFPNIVAWLTRYKK